MVTTIESKGMRLVDGKGQPINMGDTIAGFKILGGSSPRHAGSKGIVYVQERSGHKREMTPNEIGASWVSS